MKLATWNVNSLKVRLPHVAQWLENNPVDVLCLQETKMTDDKFPQAEIEALGYHVAFTGQKTYNGVAILSRHAMTDVVKNNPLFDDEQQRIISATLEGMRVICAYVPNGQAVGTDKYAYKLKWLDALARWLEPELKQHPNLAMYTIQWHGKIKSYVLMKNAPPSNGCAPCLSPIRSGCFLRLRKVLVGGIIASWLSDATWACGSTMSYSLHHSQRAARHVRSTSCPENGNNLQITRQ